MRIALMVFLALVLTGCNKLTEANYAKLKNGMTSDEIEAVIGSADRCDQALGFRACEWGDKETYIHVKYMGEKAISISKQGLH